MIDLLVVGAGPVGLVAAIHAADAGLEVAVIEPRVGTIDKACGEGLMPEALAHLKGIGVDPPGMDFRGIRYISGGRTAEARFAHGAGRGVRRTSLHESLLQRARELNIVFVEGRVDAVTQTDSKVETFGIQSRYLIAADGLHSSVRKQLKLGIDTRSESSQRYGIRQHFGIAPWSEFVEVYWTHEAEVYVTPVDPKIVGVAVLGNAKLNFEQVIRGVPQLSERLRSAPTVTKLRGAGPLRQNVRARTAGRVLLVGDAAGYVDALTGEGLRVGFAEAQAAVKAVTTDQPEVYEAEWKRITRSYRLLTNSLLRVSSNPVLRSAIVPAAKALPFVFSRLVNTVG